MKILIVDDHKFILESVEILLSTLPEHEVLGTFNNGHQLLDSIPNYDRVDIVISDYSMPEIDGISLTYKIRKEFPHIKIILLTVSEDAETIQKAFQAGISGYVMKKAGRAEFAEALKVIEEGKKYYSDSVVFQLLNHNTSMSDIVVVSVEEKLKNLSEREIEIVTLIAKELSTNQIAEKLFLSPATVETHRHNILKKLELKNSISLVKFAIKYGLIEN